MYDQMLISHTATDIVQQWVFSMVKMNHLVVEAGLKTLTAINTRQALVKQPLKTVFPKFQKGWFSV